MGGSGLIFGFVVALWAAYFVPLAVRRYDEASTSRTIERFSHRTRVIRHPDDVEAAETVAESQAPETSAVTEEAAPVRRSTRIAARRRRRTLLTLMLATVVVSVVAVLGYIPLSSIAIPVALDVAWLIACRVQVRGELGLRRVKEPREHSLRVRLVRRKAAVTAAEEEETVVLSGQFEDLEPQRKHVMEDTPLPADALDEKIVIAVPVGSTTGEALWDPLPVTLPTYVTKPRAGRTVRTIEFGAPGAWTSGHVEAENVDFPERVAGEADEQPRRRAVGD